MMDRLDISHLTTVIYTLCGIWIANSLKTGLNSELKLAETVTNLCKFRTADMWQKQVKAMCAQAFNIRKKLFLHVVYKINIILKGRSYSCHCEIYSQGIQILFF